MKGFISWYFAQEKRIKDLEAEVERLQGMLIDEVCGSFDDCPEDGRPRADVCEAPGAYCLFWQKLNGPSHV